MRILIVKTSSLGDIIHALPLLQDIKKNYPHAIIDWVSEQSFAPILLAHNNISKVINVNWRVWRNNLLHTSTWADMRTFYNELHQQNYDYILDVQGLIKSSVLCRISKISTNKNSKIYGYANASKQSGYERLGKIFYNNTIKIPYICHAVTRNRLLCAQALNYLIDENDVKFSFNFHHISHFLLNQKYAIFAHGTSRVDKEWPVQNWVDLGCYIVIEHNLSIVIPWGNEAEHKTSQLIKQKIEAQNLQAKVIILPKNTLDKLCAIIANSKLFIGVDTGLSHIASAIGIPSVIIYNFDTVWRTHAFWNPKVKSLYAEQGKSIEVHQVQNLLSRLTSSTNPTIK